MKKYKHISKSLLAIIILALVLIYMVFNKKSYKDGSVIHWDAAGYYHYLPATFIYKDLKKMTFVDSFANNTPMYSWSQINGFHEVNNNRLDKYTCGVAILECPLFLIADLSTCFFHDQRSGYSKPYQMSVQFSTIIFGILGLLILRKILKRFYNDHVVLATLIIIALGSNIFTYLTHEFGYSHIYVFFSLSCFIYYLIKWYDQPNKHYIFMLGLIYGLSIIIRLTSVLFIVFTVLFWLYQYKKNNLKIKWYEIMIFIIGTFLVVSIQLLYWHIVTGNYIFYSYKGEGFNWSSPKIWQGLFSYQKGWFIYSPLLFLGIFGIVWLYKSKNTRIYSIIFTIFLCLYIYVVFCWKMWFYGGSFGSRPMIDILPIWSFLIAHFVNYIYNSTQNKIFKISLNTIIILFTILSIFQQYQYAHYIIHWSRMSKAYYWKVFGKLEKPSDSDNLLINDYIQNSED